MKMSVSIKWLIISAFVATMTCIIVLWKYEQNYRGRRINDKRKSINVIPLHKAPVFSLGKDNKHYINNWKSTNKSLTVVTAYIDIGTYIYSGQNVQRSIEDYKVWSEPYKYLLNPLMLYTDSPVFAKHMISLRNQTGLLTKIILIDKHSLWSFKLEPKIKALYAKPEYSKLYSKIISSQYTSVSLSKLPILVDAVKRKSYRTTFYCWMDLGYLKYLKGQGKYFWLEVPKYFARSKIGVTRVFNSDLKNVDIKTIISNDLVWISGSMYLGLPATIRKLEQNFHSAVLRYLSQNLVGTDAQTIHAMYSSDERQNYPVGVYLQFFVPRTKRIPHPSQWNYLGHLMYKPEVKKKITNIYKNKYTFY